MIRLVSDIAALIGRLSDPVERTITSDLVIHQEAQITLPMIGALHAHLPLPTIIVQRSSWISSFYDHNINPDPGVVQPMAGMGRGLWKLNLCGFYACNSTFLSDVESEIFTVTYDGNGFSSPLIMIGAQATTHAFYKRELILEALDDSGSIAFRLPAAPVAGMQHQAALTVVATKLL